MYVSFFRVRILKILRYGYVQPIIKILVKVSLDKRQSMSRYFAVYPKMSQKHFYYQLTLMATPDKRSMGILGKDSKELTGMHRDIRHIRIGI